MISLVPVGPGIEPNSAAVLKSHEQAIRQLQQPDRPAVLPHVALKTDLARFAPEDWKECAMICDEINALVCSTSVAGTWTWLRADGGAI